MKNFYYTFLLWFPFVLLFCCAAYGVHLIEGDQITTSEYVGPLFYIDVFLIVLLYPFSFLPLSVIVSKYVKKPLLKMAFFTMGGGALGVIVFNIVIEARFAEQYHLSIVPSILLFSAAGFLFSLVENAMKSRIRFV